MVKKLRSIKVEDFAHVDIDRLRRRGFPEVIYCAGKSKEQIKKIAQTLLRHKQPLLLTRLEKDIFFCLKKTYPRLRYNEHAKIAYSKSSSSAGSVKNKGKVAVVCAGTSDIPVAEEAVATLEVMGNSVVKLYDVGVAGIHRVLDKKKLLNKCSAIVVVAGMEGALASIVSGLVCCPVVAVPTSIGYGANFQGLAPLLTMLNSCSPGVAVVNIDNGFGAGYFAGLVNK